MHEVALIQMESGNSLKPRRFFENYGVRLDSQGKEIIQRKIIERKQSEQSVIQAGPKKLVAQRGGGFKTKTVDVNLGGEMTTFKIDELVNRDSFVSDATLPYHKKETQIEEAFMALRNDDEINKAIVNFKHSKKRSNSTKKLTHHIKTGDFLTLEEA